MARIGAPSWRGKRKSEEANNDSAAVTVRYQDELAFLEDARFWESHRFRMQNWGKREKTIEPEGAGGIQSISRTSPKHDPA
jgi:hypothetical protein